MGLTISPYNGLQIYGNTNNHPVNALDGKYSCDTLAQSRFWQKYQHELFKKLPNGTIVVVPYCAVKSPDPLHPLPPQTPSEAMGHSLVFAAQRQDWIAFDQLLKGLYYYFRKDNGAFRWRIGIDGKVAAGEENLNSGSETEQNVAYALLIAYEKTKNTNYKDKAMELLKCMWNEEVIDFQGKLVIAPADMHSNNPYWPMKVDDNGNKRLAWSPTYLSPEHIRKFAEYDTVHNWRKVRKDWYELANKVLDLATAKGGRDLYKIAPDGINPMPQWVWLTKQSDNEIKIVPADFRDDLNSGWPYSDEGDTIRMSLYVGMDASTEEGKRFLEKFYSHIKMNKPEDAAVRLQGRNPKHHLMAIGAYAVGLKAIGRDVTEFAKRLKIDENGFGEDARWEYYDQTICYYSYLLLNDKF